ncbi:PhnD/SsuA/transferrin family substrate-binding protein [Dictyobacter arantiisoli]|nr:PhnD/SsuA/transferrin family substrate-binding protein [Dictyobacter arantiisoli]
MTPPIIFETFLAPAWYKTYQYMTEYVERYTGTSTFLLNGEALEDFADAFADVGFLTPLAYIQLLGQRPCPVELLAAAIAQEDVQHGDVPPVFFDIVVRQESRVRETRELEGCIWSYYAGMPHAEDNTFYERAVSTVGARKTVESATPVQALRSVLSGVADATAVDARMLHLIALNSPAMAARLRVVSTYSPSTGPLVVVASHVSADLKQKIQEAFLCMHKDSFFARRLQDGKLDHFISVTNAHYQDMCDCYRNTQRQVDFDMPARPLQATSAQ